MLIAQFANTVRHRLGNRPRPCGTCDLDGFTCRGSRWGLKGNLCLKKNAIPATPPREARGPSIFGAALLELKCPPANVLQHAAAFKTQNAPPANDSQGRACRILDLLYIYIFLGEIDTTPPQPMTSNTQPPPKRPPRLLV